ncbi:hypothetical protein Scep_003194 [Stephania cephalantha]|uniref:RING-type E3 ubiquitin transferase n=1 Tax=Stephania cephalantha TaxID=152367 RepID=A0AAP0KR00_9MAGN
MAAEEAKSDTQFFQVLSNLLQQVESLTNEEEVELRAKIEALGSEVTKIPSKPSKSLDELEIANELEKLSAKLDDVDKMISSAIAADPQVHTLLSSTADLWMPVITATSDERRNLAALVEDGDSETQEIFIEEMASPSLEELLAEEGFRGRKSNPNSRRSLKLESMSMPLYLFKDQIQGGSSSSGGRGARSERIRPATNETPSTEKIRSRKPREDWIASKKTAESEIIEERRSDEEESERFKDIYSNGTVENERGMNIGNMNKLTTTVMRRLSFGNNSGKTLRRSESSGSRYNGSSSRNQKKPSKVLQSKKCVDIAVPEPALDEVAVQAMISILSGYIQRFPKDEEFQELLHDSCWSCLSSMRVEEDHKTDRQVVDNLEEAIERVEKAARESGNAKELKKASLQLSVITSLNSREFKDGFTSGFPNSLLSACAHLYLGVIYKMQKKDRVSAKHLLQVFCDSPSQARKNMLPELWDLVFFPLLSHLKVWYDQEMASIPATPSRQRKVRVLEKVYNEVLDSGTYQFAVYYKDWLTEGIEAPALPSISVPSTSVHGPLKGDLVEHSPDLPSAVDSTSSQQLMISERLYKAVFVNSNSQEGIDESDEENEEENYDENNSIYGSAEEDKRMIVYSPKQGSSSASIPFQQDLNESTSTDIPNHAYGQLRITEEGSALPIISASKEEEKFNDKIENVNVIPVVRGSMHMLQALPLHKANELILWKLAESVFSVLEAKSSDDFSAVVPTTHFTARYANDGCFDQESFFSNIPKDFVCPLTGEVFEDPVTLETGHTFEQKAIKERFDKGNKTCPISGRSLECLSLPTSNFVLKRVVESWMSEHYKNLLLIASKVADHSFTHGCKAKDETVIYILEQLLNCFKAEERLANAKQLISLGGLKFLLCRFDFGNLEEKKRVAALLTSCIKAAGECRNYVVENINRSSLLQLLHKQQVKSRATAAEPRKYSIYREEAVDSITVALECSLNDEKIREQCCGALLILGGQFSFSGEVVIEGWLLRQAGFCDAGENCQIDETIQVEEEKAREDWWKNLAASLLGNGKRSFLETIAKCLNSRNSRLMSTCLITVAWISQALALLSDAEFQLSAFSTLVACLKETLENGRQIEHRVIACMTLLNFSQISECRILLSTIAEEISRPLQSLTEITWTAKQLLEIISRDGP